MTIARDFVSGSEDSESGVLAALEREFTVREAVPFEVRAERLARQVQLFERAGYRLETQSALQAIVVKPVTRRAARAALLAIATAGLYLVPLLAGAGKRYHRVAITVDAAGVVGFA